jgi:DNA polymerase III sliding clamp (beta) subunit (PCNA family)
MKKYPDISEIIKKKEKHRRELAALPFEEKIEMVFKLQERRKFIKAGRRANSLKKPKMKSV